MLRSDTLFGKRDTISPNVPISGNNNLIHPNTLSKTHAQLSHQTQLSSSSNEIGSKLIVGQNIKLKGVEINDCDTLVVEGRVEVTMDSRVIQISENGAFQGSAEVDFAEIHGNFDGELTARHKLLIYATGKVSGKIRYGKLVIEEGGQISGDIQVINIVDAKHELQQLK